MNSEPFPVFSIQHYGTSEHARGRIDGRIQETRTLDDYRIDESTNASVIVYMENGVRLPQPKIIRFR